MNVQSKRLVVGLGFIGSALTENFLKIGHVTRALSRGAVPGICIENASSVDRIVGDATDSKLMRESLAGIDQVYWCAGGQLPVESEEDVLGSIADRCRPLLIAFKAIEQMAKPPQVFLFSSGGTIYGDYTDVPISEDSLTSPTTAYGIANLCSELLARKYAARLSLRLTIFRCANVYGKYQQPGRSQGLIATAIESGRNGNPITIFGDGESIRDYIHIDDVVQIVERVSNLVSSPSVLNVGTGVGTTVNEVLSAVEKSMDIRFDVKIAESRSSDVRSAVLDPTLVRTLTGIRTISLSDGILRTVSGY